MSQRRPNGDEVNALDRDRYMRSVVEHKRLVSRYMLKVIAELIERSTEHDYSKFGPEEFGPYVTAYPRFQVVKYGSPEYADCVRSIKPAIEHHVTTNAHHPESHDNGIYDMTLLDLLEMVCDWIAASQRVPGDRLRLDLQRERFGIDDTLFHIIERTVRELMGGDDGTV